MSARAFGSATMVALALLGTVTTSVSAPSSETAAEAAFSAGRALLKEGRYEEACKKFDASFILDPALGTLLNLADCLERSGRTASAWRRYREAAGMALLKGQREREAIAREKVADLEPNLCRLTVRASSAGLAIRRDGVPVGAEELDLPVPVDPGKHVLEAASGGQTVARREVLIAGAALSQTCSVVVSFDDVSLPPPRREDATPPTSPGEGLSTRRVVAAVLAGSGLIGLGVGTAFGLSASSAKNEADRSCTDAGCTAEGRGLLDDAGKRADIATVGFIVGAALIAAGAALWFTDAPKAAVRPPSARLFFVLQF